eukprot:3735914-Pyramimonas_sp.AAC.1
MPCATCLADASSCLTSVPSDSHMAGNLRAIGGAAPSLVIRWFPRNSSDVHRCAWAASSSTPTASSANSGRTLASSTDARQGQDGTFDGRGIDVPEDAASVTEGGSPVHQPPCR